MINSKEDKTKNFNEKYKIDFVKWFSELNKNSVNTAGGKGANLAEIYNLGIPVPPGFVVTAQAYKYFIEKAGIEDGIKILLSQIDYENTKQLDEITKKIREHILKATFPKEMQDEILEAYDVLNVEGFDEEYGGAIEILKSSKEPLFVAVRSSATAEDLADASFAGQQDSFLNVKGKINLIEHVKKCFASLFTSRATYYRHKKGFDHDKVNLAVVVQKMVDSDKSGVMFTKDPTFKDDNIIIEAVWGLGEGIVSGRITPDKYVVNEQLDIIDKILSDKKIALTRDSSGAKAIVKLREEKSKSQVLKDHEIRRFAEYGIQLEKHYQKAQDVEFAVEGNSLFIVQTRPITTLESRKAKETGKEIQGEIVLRGLAASPGISTGKVKIINKLEDLQKINKGDILVTEMTNPDMVVSMQKSAAIITDEGGMTAHAAIISREMGIPCVVGTREATTKLKESEFVTVDGFNGIIYKGKVSESVQKQIEAVTAKTKTKIKIIVDLPTFAQRAARTGIKEVGLTRIEGIIAESGKHPRFFLKQGKIKEYENIIYEGIHGIAKYFDELWIRTSDIRTDEFENLEGAPKEKEANPMLGFHGIRYSLKNPDILKAELNALKKVARQNKKIGLLLPQVISVREVQEVKKILKEIEFNDCKVGVMIETPAAIQIISDLCNEGIDFISFGTNDLTQYILAVDRGNEEVQHLYDEMHPAILRQIEYVIRACKKYNVETSICGQAGSKKSMVKFLVEKDIDGISVNADMAKEISDYIAQVETERGESPRQYKPAKEKILEEKNLQEENDKIKEENYPGNDNSVQDDNLPEDYDNEQQDSHQLLTNSNNEPNETSFEEQKSIEEDLKSKEQKLDIF